MPVKKHPSVLLAALLVIGCGGSPTSPVADSSSPAPQAEASVAPASAVVVSGTGRQNTKPFTLGPGSYGIAVTGDSNRDTGYVTFKMYPVTPDPSDARDVLGWLLFNTERISAKGPFSFETNEYNLEGREYYLTAITPGGPWTVTFTPQS